MMRVLRITLRTLLILFLFANLMAAIHAYKFTRFYDKEPDTAIRKPEQMSAWDKSKLLLFGLNAPKSVSEGQPAVPYDTVAITTADSLHLKGWYLPHDSAKGTVLLFHGHGGSKSGVLKEATYMHSLGFNALLIDFRAHGDSEGYTCTIGYREAADVKAAYEYIQNKGEQHIVLWGISLGAATLSRAIAEYNLKPEKAIMELSFGSAYGAVKGRVRIMGLPEQPASAMLTFWGSVVRGLWFFNLSPEEYVKKMHCPVLVQHAAHDARVTRAETDLIYQNIPHQQKKLVVYETAMHESLCAKEPEKWQGEIKAFLLGR